ncbi:MAG: monovalent cation/H+ antiporter subunit A [Deltaproteobacteria bacterium]|nr:MAG: monovalent cation/H+ antiporter subunit A [Deltaproteobacteria bacterium]
MTLLLVILIPLLGAMLPPLMMRWGRGASAGSAILVTLAALGAWGSMVPAALRGEGATFKLPWIPALGLNLSLTLDGLALLFSGLILGIGLLVVLYAKDYLYKSDPMGRFFAYLLLFMGAMLGVVLSANLLLTVVFWELTSITSFLLIGFWGHRADARRGARMALTITGLGGLCFLGGALLLGHLAGTFEIAELTSLRDSTLSHGWYVPALVLILLGAFTKSAQFPFQFWLPQAMAAPTPVSSYLHSATMVKAGVFLIARLHPALGGSEVWFYLVGGVGLATLLVGAFLANLAYDLKGLLAYSTVSHLGLIVALLGIGTQYAVVAAIFHILNHALFKASLFMSAGIVDHQAGTRDLRSLGGLWRLLPFTAPLALIAAAAMAGLPPLNGFLSKELFLEQTLELPFAAGPWWLVPALATLGALLSMGYAVRFGVNTFLGPQPKTFPKPPIEPPWGMRIPVALLVAGCVAIGLLPDLLGAPIVELAAAASSYLEVEGVHFALWHGFTPALLMSGIAIVGGVGLWYLQRWFVPVFDQSIPLPSGERLFRATIAGLVDLSRSAKRAFHPGKLQTAIAWMILSVVLLVGSALLVKLPRWTPSPADIDPSLLGGVALLLLAIGAALYFHRRRAVSLAILGAVGLLLSMGFVYLSAPDLALTQLSVEVSTIVLMLLALHLLPAQSVKERVGLHHLRDGVLALGAAVVVGTLTWLLLIDPPTSATSAYYLAQSKPGGGGTNVVNVILVDFRGFDTFGEVIVLGIAALGVYAMLFGMGLPTRWTRPETPDESAYPLMLGVVARVLLPLALVVGIYLFLRGHNEPGGGFVAGLVFSAAIILQYLASGIGWTQHKMNIPFHPLIALGIFVAGLTGVIAIAFGQPFLRSWFEYYHVPILGEIELASAMAFDLGVTLTVVGGLLMVLVNLSKLPRSTSVRPLTLAEEED